MPPSDPPLTLLSPWPPSDPPKSPQDPPKVSPSRPQSDPESTPKSPGSYLRSFEIMIWQARSIENKKLILSVSFTYFYLNGNALSWKNKVSCVVLLFFCFLFLFCFCVFYVFCFFRFFSFVQCSAMTSLRPGPNQGLPLDHFKHLTNKQKTARKFGRKIWLESLAKPR